MIELVARRTAGPRARPVLDGTAVGITFALGACAMSLAGGARAVTPAFVVGGVAVAYLLSRTRPLASAEFALWLWLLGPLVRRVVDGVTGYHDPSPILLAAPLASLVMAPRIRQLRWQPVGRAARPLLIMGVALGSAYAVGAVQSGIRPATAALLVWMVPPLFGLQILVIGRDVEALRAMVQRTFVWGALLVGGYAVVQFYVVPSWDAFWMDHTSMTSIGRPHPFEVRVFSTLNSPGPMAMYLAAAALYLTSTTHPLRFAAQLAAFAGLALSLVRSAWLGCLVGLLIVLAAGRSRERMTALVAVGVLAVAALHVSGPVQAVIAERISDSREGTGDDSFQGRLYRHETVLPSLVDDVVGTGLGSAGGGGLGRGGPSGIDDLDSGLLAFGVALGLPAAAVALGAVAYASFAVTRAGLRRDALPIGVVAAGVALLSQMVAGNVLTGVTGMTFYLLWSSALLDVLAGPDGTTRTAAGPGGARVRTSTPAAEKGPRT